MAVKKLKVDLADARFFKERAHPREHLIARGLGRKREVASVLADPSGKMLREVHRGFGLSLAHRRFDDEQGWLGETRCRIDRRALERVGIDIRKQGFEARRGGNVGVGKPSKLTDGFLGMLCGFGSVGVKGE